MWGEPESGEAEGPASGVWPLPHGSKFCRHANDVLVALWQTGRVVAVD
jgi:hypothetical protein